MDNFKKVISVVQKQQTSLGFGLIALLTAGGEQIFSSVVFDCPCSRWSFTYGMVFLLVPALALLVLGYIMSNTTWKLFTGLCNRKTKFEFSIIKNVCACGIVFFHITTNAIVAPITWIAVALLNGKFFECAVTGINVTVFTNHLCDGMTPECQNDLMKFPCDKAKAYPGSNVVLATIRAESQVLGWILIASIMIFNLFLICVAQCNSPVSYLQLKFWKAYTRQESDLLEIYSADNAKKLADRNMKSFFQQTAPESIKTPDDQAWEKISSLYKFSSKNTYYSILHKYVEGLNESASGCQSDGPDAVNPAALSFVDEGKTML